MTTFPGSPHLLNGDIVLLDAETVVVRRIIALRFNPDTLTRSSQVKCVAADRGDHSAALRLKGLPVDPINLDAAIHAGKGRKP